MRNSTIFVLAALAGLTFSACTTTKPAPSAPVAQAQPKKPHLGDNSCGFQGPYCRTVSPENAGLGNAGPGEPLSDSKRNPTP